MCDRCRCVVVQAGVARHSPGVRDALLFVLIRALYCASLQCVSDRTRRREDEPKWGSFFFVGESQLLLMLALFLYCSGHHASYILRNIIRSKQIPGEFEFGTSAPISNADVVRTSYEQLNLVKCSRDDVMQREWCADFHADARRESHESSNSTSASTYGRDFN